MKTSAQWWAETKADEKNLIDWLQRQYRGEMRAAKRLQHLLDLVCDGLKFQSKNLFNEQQVQTLMYIAQDEAKHASWIFNLLQNRGVTGKQDDANADKRYWSAYGSYMMSRPFDELMAIGAHAEKMRLERIECIAYDPDAPQDIRNTFLNILRDEVFHEHAFRRMATEETMAATAKEHNAGKKLLGLEA